MNFGRNLARFFLILFSMEAAGCAGATLPSLTTHQNHAFAKPGSQADALPGIACLPGECNGVGGGGDAYDPENCAASEIYCNFVPGDITDDITYTGGGGGSQPWTQYPSSCVEDGTSAYWSSPIDGAACSTWQVFHFFSEYCDISSNTCQSVGNGAIAPFYEISVSIGNPAMSSGSGGIPGLGHLFITLWLDGARTKTLEAGPTSLLPGSKLILTTYPADVDGSAAVFTVFVPPPTSNVTAQSEQSHLAVENNNFQAKCNDYWPYPVYNSNTFIDGMLLAAGYSEAQITQIVTYLETLSALNPEGYTGGSTLEYCFQ